MKISINPIQYKAKPDKPTIQKELFKPFVATETTISGLGDYVSKGHTIAPAILKNSYRNNANFISSQAVFLDYDDDQDYLEIIEQIEEFGFKVNIFYNSFSHQTAPKFINKFRLVIVLDSMIHDKALFKGMIEAFIDLTGADRGCKDPSRMFFAGNNVKVLSEQENSFDQLSGAFIDLMNIKKQRQHYGKTKKRVDKAKKCSKRDIPYNIYSISENEQKNAPKHQNFDFERACQNSKVFDGFDKGTIELKYHSLRALITAMMQVKGGMKWVKNRMDLRNTYKNEDYSLAWRIPNEGYTNAESMKSFDPSIVNDYRNVLFLDDKQRDVVTQIRELNKKDVDDVWKDMNVHFNNALRSKNLVSIIKSPPSIGKTELIIKLTEALVAVPTHDLKDELGVRMDDLGLPYVLTPRNPIFESIELNKKYDSLQKMEENNLASSLITSVSEGKDIDGIEYTDVDIEIASEYKRELAIAYESDVMVITTHDRAILTPFAFKNKNKLVFDEDIISKLLDYKAIKYSDVKNKLENLLRTSKEGTDFNKDVKEVIKAVKGLDDGEVANLDMSICWENRYGFFMNLASRQGYNKLANFINSSKSIKWVDENDITTYNYGNLKELSAIFDKIFIFSATASRKKYDNYFKAMKWDYDFFDSGLAINKGVVKQNLTKSYSQTTLKKGTRPEVESNLVITYKKYAGDFEGNEAKDIYFGNTEGKNFLKGKDTSIVGLHIKPVNASVMECILLGLDYETTYKDMVMVTNDYFTYPFFTFVDKNLRDIEMSSAESELEQATGRSRALRTDAKVDVHTSLPIPSVDIFEGKKIIKTIDESLPSLSTEFVSLEDDAMWFDIQEAERKAPPKEESPQVAINFKAS